MASHQQITGLSAVQTPTVPASARVAYVQAETQNVHYTIDGTAPATTNGLLLVAGASPTKIAIEGGLAALKFKEDTPSAKVNMAYLP